MDGVLNLSQIITEFNLQFTFGWARYSRKCGFVLIQNGKSLKMNFDLKFLDLFFFLNRVGACDLCPSSLTLYHRGK